MRHPEPGASGSFEEALLPDDSDAAPGFVDADT
jgi:hypothetical protein